MNCTVSIAADSKKELVDGDPTCRRGAWPQG